MNDTSGKNTLPKHWQVLVKELGNLPAYRKKSRGVWRTLTWREWHVKVCLLVRDWQKRGMDAGASVLVLAGNGFEWPIVDMAAQTIGAAIVGLHPSASDAEIEIALEASAPNFAVLEDWRLFERLHAAGKLEGVTTFVIEAGSHGLGSSTGSVSTLAVAGELDQAAENAIARLIQRGCGATVATHSWDAVTGKARAVSQIDLCRQAAAQSGTDGKWTLALVSSASVSERLRQWRTLASGGTVHLPEDPGTISNDLREVNPDVVFAPATFWESQRAELMSTMADASPLARALFARASGTTTPGRLYRALLRNVRSHMGIARARAVFSAEPPPEAQLLDWYRSIGATVVLGAGR